MKIRDFLFQRTGGHWMFWTGFIYLAVGVTCALYYKDIRSEVIQLTWIMFLAMPFYFPPLGRWLNMDVTWDKNMFNLFGKKESTDNVYNLPTPKAVPPMPEVKKEEPAKIFYRLGLTDNNRVAFSMGYSEITMSKEGVQQMIDQLTFFQSQLYDEDDNGGPDGGGGEPLPIPEQKAA